MQKLKDRVDSVFHGLRNAFTAEMAELLNEVKEVNELVPRSLFN